MTLKRLFIFCLWSDSSLSLFLMENSTKILAGATCALAVAAVGGCWFYGIYSAGKTFDETAISNFSTVLPAELAARVTQYEGGFFKKTFQVTFEAVGGIQLGTFNGQAYPGLTTKVELTRAPDTNFEQGLLRAGVQNFDDRIEVSYTAWDAITSGSQALPSARLTYKIKPFTVVAGGQCSFEDFEFDIETGKTLEIRARTPGLSCRPVGQPELKLGKFEFSFVSDAEPIAKALNGENSELAQTSLTMKLGSMVGAAARFDGFDFKLDLKPEEGAKTWTETLSFSLKNPASPALYLELGQIGAIDDVSGSVRVTGITEELCEQFAQILLGPSYLHDDLLTLTLMRGIQNDGVAVEIDPLSVSIDGSRATLSGALRAESTGQGNQPVGRFHFESDESILPPELIADALMQGFVKQEKNKIKSEIVLTPEYGTANGLQLY